LSVRLHHFRSHVVAKSITIEHISTKEQIADMFTKPLARPQFCKLRNRLMGWPLSPSRGSVRIMKETAGRAYAFHSKNGLTSSTTPITFQQFDFGTCHDHCSLPMAFNSVILGLSIGRRSTDADAVST
jgi:hypothetical protein